jgi:uncharacterized membrane protein YqjE
MTVSGNQQVPSGGMGSTGSTATDRDERSVGELLGDITSNLTTLMKQELDLAKTEAKNEAAKAGRGAGLMAGAGVTGHLALLFASLALMFLLDTWMHTAWAALIVMALWAVVAAVLASRGRKELKELNPKLETTQRTLKEDVQWARDQKSSS